MGDLILADFKSKTYHKPDPITLERLAAEILGEISTGGVAVGNEFPNKMIPYGGQGIDGMDLGKEPA
jgi:hypothetical protein